jgi:PAS domain S-box-containing protein
MVFREKQYEMILSQIIDKFSKINGEAEERPENKKISKKLNELKLILKSLRNNPGKNPLEVIQTIKNGINNDSIIPQLSGNDYFQWIINNMDDIVSIFDSNLNLEFINNAQERYSGFTKEEIVGKNTARYIHPDDQFKVLSVLKNSYKKGYGEAEYRMRTKEGKYVWLHGKGHLVKKGGKTKIIIIGRDITQRKKLENQLTHWNKKLEERVERRTRRLKESQEKYKILTENVSDLIMSIDSNLNIDYFNHQIHKEILGYKEDELMNEPVSNILHPEEYQKALDTVKQTFENGSGKLEFRVKHKNGNFLWFESKARRYTNEEGERKVIVISRDITKRREFEHQLKELNKLKSDLLRRASHELKTPLVAIKGYTNFLLENYSQFTHDDIIDVLTQIRSGAERLQDLINEILKASKLELKADSFHPEYEDLTFLIQFVIDELQGYIRTRQHQLEVNLHEDLRVKCEKEKIYEVFTNLLSNAIKYTPKRGKITVKSQKLEDKIIISVKDTGIGFTQNEKKQIFKKFGKIERYGNGYDIEIDGHGLGLYNSKKLIELHGGELWMKSPGRNRGSTFYFSLPSG